MKKKPLAISDYIDDRIDWTQFVAKHKLLFIVFFLLFFSTVGFGIYYNYCTLEDFSIDLLIGVSTLISSFILSVAVYYSTWKSDMIQQKADRPRVVFGREIDSNTGRLRDTPRDNALLGLMDEFSFINISVKNCGNRNLHGLHIDAIYRSKNNKYLGKEDPFFSNINFYETIGFHESFIGESAINKHYLEDLKEMDSIDYTCVYTVIDDLLNTYVIIHRFSYGPGSWGDYGTVVLSEKEATRYHAYISKLKKGDKMLYMYRRYYPQK